jgi:hypothetical protein
VEFAHQPCLVRGFVDRVEIHVQDRCGASHPRSPERARYVLEPRHYLPLLARKPGCLDNARALRGEPFGEDFAWLRRELEFRHGEAGTRQYIRVLLLLTTHPEAAVRAAVSVCVKRRAFHDQLLTEATEAGGDGPTPDTVISGVGDEDPRVQRRFDRSHAAASGPQGRLFSQVHPRQDTHPPSESDAPQEPPCSDVLGLRKEVA